MAILYRLEDKGGNGPFFYKNGQARFDCNIRCNDAGLIIVSSILTPTGRSSCFLGKRNGESGAG